MRGKNNGKSAVRKRWPCDHPIFSASPRLRDEKQTSRLAKFNPPLHFLRFLRGTLDSRPHLADIAKSLWLFANCYLLIAKTLK
jgi:hypothetical protein